MPNVMALPAHISTEADQFIKVGNSWQWQYYLTDQLGNVRLVLDEGGNVVQETDYYPFGLAIAKNPSDLAQSRARNKYLYLNRELQPVTGWLDLKARFYDPAIGRFMSVDPLTDQQEQLTPYHYGYNNPLRYSDPDGKCPDCDDPYLFARLAVTAFYDTKHAVENTALRLIGSDTRVGYRVVDGREVFETVAYKTSPANSAGDGIREVANAALDITSIAGAGTGGVTGGILSRSGNGSQVAKVIKYEVGTYDNLVKRSMPGDGLDIHHVPQKQPAGQIIDGYDKKTGPSIAIPTGEHRQIPTSTAQCIQAALALKALFRLAFRQTQGLIQSVLTIMKLDLQVPSYSQLCRRQARLNAFSVADTGYSNGGNYALLEE